MQFGVLNPAGCRYSSGCRVGDVDFAAVVPWDNPAVVLEIGLAAMSFGLSAMTLARPLTDARRQRFIVWGFALAGICWTLAALL